MQVVLRYRFDKHSIWLMLVISRTTNVSLAEL